MFDSLKFWKKPAKNPTDLDVVVYYDKLVEKEGIHAEKAAALLVGMVATHQSEDAADALVTLLLQCMVAADVMQAIDANALSTEGKKAFTLWNAMARSLKTDLASVRSAYALFQFPRGKYKH